MATLSRPEPKDHEAFMEDQPELRLYTSFDDMHLNPLLLRGIYSNLFDKPIECQQRCIVPMIQGSDIIVQAQSGTGKTSAFCIAVLQRIDFRADKSLQALILSPTRELAHRTCELVSQLGMHLSASTPFCHTFVGGTRLQEDLAKAQGGALVAVGTPGRVSDVIKRGALRTDALRVLVIDGAEAMLSEGFSDQIDDIFRLLPKGVQVAIFTENVSDEVFDLTRRHMRNPTRILMTRRASLTLEGIKQFYVAVEEEYKLETLIELYESFPFAQSVIFANTSRKVEWLSERLEDSNLPLAVVHDGMPRDDREKVITTFRSGLTRVLVTTDPVARGMVVHHVNIVVNYDLPSNPNNYLHRVGRGGCFGRKGVAINFVSVKDVELVRRIEAEYHTQIDELPMDFAAYLPD